MLEVDLKKDLGALFSQYDLGLGLISSLLYCCCCCTGLIANPLITCDHAPSRLFNITYINAQGVNLRSGILYVGKIFREEIMYGSFHVLYHPPPPPRQPLGQVRPFKPGGGELFEAVLSRGTGVGKIDSNFSLFL